MIARTIRIATVCATVISLAACVSAPVAKKPVLQDQSKLYAGQPATVHGTEFPVTSSEDGVARGDAAWQQGDPDRALYLYVQALQFDSNDAATLRKIGAIHEARGNRPLARQAFEMSVARDNIDPPTLERLGLIYLQDNDNAKARAMLERSLAISPYRWRAHNALGVVLDRAGLHTQALEHYDIALALEPSEAGATLNNRGYSKFLAGDLAGAKRDLHQAIERGAGGPAWLNLGRAQARGREYSAALKSFRETLDAARAYNEAGEAALRNGDRQIAKSYFQSATEASPSYYEAAYRNLEKVNDEMLRAPMKASR